MRAHPSLCDVGPGSGQRVESDGRPRASIAPDREALEMCRRLYAGVDHPSLSASLINVGSSLFLAGDSTSAAPLFREAAALLMRIMPHRDDPNLAMAPFLLALSLTTPEQRAASVYVRRLAVEMPFRIVMNNIGGFS